MGLNIAVERNSSHQPLFYNLFILSSKLLNMTPKTLDDILPPLMPPPLELDFLSLECHFSGYKDDTPDSNSHWSCSNKMDSIIHFYNKIKYC